MAKDILKKEIISDFIKKTDLNKKQSVRDFISRLKIKECPKATQNAAAQVAALTKGFSVARRLSKTDKGTLPGNLSEIVDKYNHKSKPERTQRTKKIKVIKVAPDFGEEFIEEANQNAEIYPYIYILENSLRKCILKKYEDKDNWWLDKKIVHGDIQEYSKKIQNAEKRYKWMDKRGNHPIYYVNLEHLFKIIERNWKDFKYIFSDQGHLRTWIAESVPIRNLLAHNIKTKKEERDNIKQRVKNICKTIENTF